MMRSERRRVKSRRKREDRKGDVAEKRVISVLNTNISRKYLVSF
jgi:hypothetical protein